MLVVACGLFAMFFFNTPPRPARARRQRAPGRPRLPARSRRESSLGAAASQQLIARLGAREVPIIGLALAVVGMLFFLPARHDQHVRGGHAAGDHADVDRHGPDVRAGDADRDERRSRRRRRARLGSLQHLPAGRRRARARASVHVRGQQDYLRTGERRTKRDPRPDRRGARRRLPRRPGRGARSSSPPERCFSSLSCAAATSSPSRTARKRLSLRSAVKFAPFRIERYYAVHEFTAPYMLSSSDAESRRRHRPARTRAGRRASAGKRPRLGYTETVGAPELREAIAAMYHHDRSRRTSSSSPPRRRAFSWRTTPCSSQVTTSSSRRPATSRRSRSHARPGLL